MDIIIFNRKCNMYITNFSNKFITKTLLRIDSSWNTVCPENRLSYI